MEPVLSGVEGLRMTAVEGYYIDLVKRQPSPTISRLYLPVILNRSLSGGEESLFTLQTNDSSISSSISQDKEPNRDPSGEPGLKSQ